MGGSGFAMMGMQIFKNNKKLRNRRKNFKEQKQELQLKTAKIEVNEAYQFLEEIDIRAERKAFIRRDDRIYYVIMFVMFLSSIWYVMNYGGF